MKLANRLLMGLVAMGLLMLLAHAINAPESAARRLPMLALAGLALVASSRPPARWTLAVLVPAGPILDLAFLTPDRGIYATEVVLLAAVATWLASGALARRQTSWVLPALPALLLAGFGLVGSTALLLGHRDAFATFEAWRALRVLLLASGAVFLLRAVAERTPRPVATLWTGATLGALLLLAAGGVLEFVIKASGQFEAGSFYASSIGLAVHLAFMAPLALCIWLGPSSRRWRVLAAAAWLGSLACLPLTASRGALGSLAVTSVLAVLVTARRTGGRGWRGMAAVLLALGVATAVLMARPELAGEAFAYKYRASVQGDFFSTRTTEWAEAWQAIIAHPLVGDGPAEWAPSVPLELARRHGVPAALLALAAMVTGAWVAGRRGWRRDDGEAAMQDGLHLASLDWGLCLALCGLFLVGLAETGLGARSTPLLAWAVVMAGMVHGQRPGST